MAVKDLINQISRSKIVSKAKELIDRDKSREGVQFVSPNLKQNISQGVENYFNQPRQQISASGLAYRTAKNIGQQVQQGTEALKARQESINQRTQGLSFLDRLKSPATQQENQQLLTGAKSAGIALAPTNLPFTLASMGLAGGFSSLQGQDPAQAMAQTAFTAPVSGQFIKVTNPLIKTALSKIKAPQIVQNRVTPAIANVAQGIGIDVATGQKTTPLSVGIDVLAGVAGKQSQFGDIANAKGITTRSKTVSNALNKEKEITKVINDLRTPKVMNDPVLGGENIQLAEKTWKEVFGKTRQLPKDVNQIVGELEDALSGAKTQKLMESEGIKLGFADESIPKEQLPLYQEAKKYKSAEEFVNSMEKGRAKWGTPTKKMPSVQNSIDHAPYTLDKLDSSIKNNLLKINPGLANEKITIYRVTPGNIEAGDMVFHTLSDAKTYAERQKGITVGDIKSKIIKSSEFAPAFDSKTQINNRYIGTYQYKKVAPSFDLKEGVYVPSDLKTKSQLTDIWNKANQPSGIAQLQSQIPGMGFAQQGKIKTNLTKEPKPFISERDLPIKTQENLKKVYKQADADFRDWDKQLRQQEALKTSRIAPSVTAIGKEIKQGVIPPYLSEENLTKVKDISPMSGGFRDVYRNFDEVFGENSQVHKEILVPFDRSKAKLVDDLNKQADNLETNIVKKLGIEQGTEESAAVQQFGEGNRDFQSLVTEFGEDKAKKIAQANEWFRKQYDVLLDDVNEARARIYPNQPDKLIPKRKDYYRHFTDLTNSFSGLKNLFETPANIAPDLAGISAQTKPKTKWLSFAQKRLGVKTEEDAIAGYIDYVKAQSYAKHIDPFISKFRGLAESVAQATSNPESKNFAKLNNFKQFLEFFSNDLAGKTNEFDRSIQNLVGRKPLKIINWINSRTKANVIVGNLSSSIAQFFNIPQGIAEAGVINSVNGLKRSMAGLLDKNSIIKESDFIKTRYSGDEFARFDESILKTPKKLALWITGIGDEIGTKYIWNSLYEKALNSGVENPIRYADDLTRKMVAGRGIGEVPLMQKAQTFQLIAPFQLEVANIWHVMKKWGGEKAANKFITFFVASHIMNGIAKSVRGSDVSLDPIQAVKEAYEAFNEEEDKKIGLMRAGGRLGGELLSNVPGGQTVAAIYPEYGATIGETKLPTREQLFGEGDPTRFGSGLLAQKGLQDPGFLLAPPFGGTQLKRTIQGIKSYQKGFSESASGRVRYPIAKTPTNLIRSATFGQYSLPEARNYFDQNGSVLGEQQSEAFKNLSPNERQKYFESISANREINRGIEKIKTQGAEAKIDTSKLTTKQAIETTRAKVESGIDVPKEELYTAYLNKPLSMKSTNKYEKSLKDSELYGKISDINSNEYLSEEQKNILLDKVSSELGVSRSELDYYDVAKREVAQKTLYVLDQVPRFTNETEFVNYLVEGRRKVNGQQLVSSGVIDNLVDEGLISESLGKQLKKVTFDKKTGKVGTGRAKKAKVIEPPTFKVSTSRSKIEAPKIKAISGLQPGKYKLKSPTLKTEDIKIKIR